MKKVFLTFAILGVIGGSIYTGCNTQSQMDSTQNDTIGRNIPAKKDTVVDIQKFRKDAETRFLERDKNISELKDRLEKESQAVKKEGLKQLKSVENRNKELKKSLAEYKDEGEDAWKKFMVEFDRNMDEIAKSIKEISEKNSKQKSDKNN